ncbi:16S rRNA (guanine(527)-N(7))-methyltransferase RsmG [Candidatus Peregrinibacteria bacterium RIFOXYC2_FULL_33_13]|nr:MAG: Ribosomal RNA small subunit methyltransferase G [Candidatus Peregrinibacteria bacterium GW2011_GWA2_33_10]KKP41176.1 MAG: ribosomal RNA small subunit methyltransferase G [Candidatus Peregrinibacteria bacterium GW2011_GWC2_33_13]OGJ47909.1 MAG: 16S rRNA (guanine(527)-N(7))-methyltransferase RsmG [Candidatus Peregrinibacteria bacterium RIFOXYA2_FULL_33_7]OGJ52660.1 MAG: 16S rRNA (guanine(527)-N(7))-methyltransferase RsmG [Candidatus Peregrinibacteria bacterium RIFOXYC2_FULL_33_13]
MDQTTFSQIFKIDEDRLSGLNLFKKLLWEENRKINLFSRKLDIDDLDAHFIDSLFLMKFIDLNGKNVVDIGSGGGFPALPLAICNPKTEFTLIESSTKKSNFLFNVINKLNLRNVKIINDRAENVSNMQNLKEHFDLSIMRAVAKVPTLLEYARPFLKKCGLLGAYKSLNFQSELDLSKSILKELGFNFLRYYEYELPKNGSRCILVFEKDGGYSVTEVRS